MARREYLRCYACAQDSDFVVQTRVWLMSCGHLRCETHLMERCCGEVRPLVDVKGDEVIHKTSEFLQFLQSMGKSPYLSIAVDPLTEILICRIEEIFAAQSCEQLWVCHRCGNENSRQDAECKYCDNSEAVVSCTSAEPEDPLLSLETLTMSESQRQLPWICPKCQTVIPASSNRCQCGYINLKKVDIEFCDEKDPTSQKAVDSLDIRQEYWRCEQCTYEYNLMGTAACTRCNRRKREEKRTVVGHCSLCGKASVSIEQSLCSTCRLEQKMTSHWICPKCKVFNLLANKCTKCSKHKEDYWTCEHCKYAANRIKNKKCEKCEWLRCKKCLVSYPNIDKSCPQCSKRK